MSNKTILLILVMAGVLTFVLYLNRVTQNDVGEEYNPNVDPSNFVSVIDNKYFTLVPGTTFTFESDTKEGLERVEVEVTNELKEVMGVKTVVVQDRVWLDNKLIEDTKDWYAQDGQGNVWYFGEETKEYDEKGEVSTAGSWEAGVDGAYPGIIMKANPQVGDSYRQEYYKGEAEDMGEVVALGKVVEVLFGTYGNCLQIRDFSMLDASNEYKFYCPDVGFVVLEESVDGGQVVELVRITTK